MQKEIVTGGGKRIKVNKKVSESTLRFYLERIQAVKERAGFDYSEDVYYQIEKLREELFDEDRVQFSKKFFGLKLISLLQKNGASKIEAEKFSHAMKENRLEKLTKQFKSKNPEWTDGYCTLIDFRAWGLVADLDRLAYYDRFSSTLHCHQLLVSLVSTLSNSNRCAFDGQIMSAKKQHHFRLFLNNLMRRI